MMYRLRTSRTQAITAKPCCCLSSVVAVLEVLAAVPNETAVPMTELGHSTEVDENADKPAWFY
jgi:hypothetical protein